LKFKIFLTFKDLTTIPWILLTIPPSLFRSGTAQMARETRREVLGMSKITYKFQVTIPKRVREKFGLKQGEVLVFVEENGRIIIVKSTEL